MAPLAFPEAFARLRGDAVLAVYIDLKSPYAYIAIDPTRAMAERLGVTVDWRPFTLDIPSYLGSAKLAKDGKTVASADRTPQQWSGVKYSYRDARRYGALTGKTVRGTVKIWDSSLAGIAMLWAKRQGAFDRFVDAAYPPFWRRELDIEDLAVLEDVLARAGVETVGFDEWASGEGRRLHDESNAAAFAAGVYGVPTYLVEDEMWFGREHLPRIQWILEGRRGAAPEVANRGFSAASDAGTPHPARRDAAAGPDRALTVALDLRHPFSYLTLAPTLALASEEGVRVDWLPVRGASLRPPSEPGREDDRSIRHRRARAQAIAREIAIHADAQGVEIAAPYRDGSSEAFEAAWLWLRDEAPEAVERLLREAFQRYWRDVFDPADLAAVRELLGELALDVDAFDAWRTVRGEAVRSAAASELAEMGVNQGPAYVLDGEVFLGRQHLPMIRWILRGRSGPPPI